MARKLSMMGLMHGDVFATATLDDNGIVTLSGDDDDLLDDYRIVAGPKGQLRPRDGEPYFDALKDMFSRMTYGVAFEPHEERKVRGIVKRVRATEAADEAKRLSQKAKLGGPNGPD